MHILEIIELDSRQVELKKERLFDLRDFLIGIAIEYSPLIRKKFIHINVTRQTPTGIDLYVDKTLFYLAVSNILDNSVKYSFFPEERQKLGFQVKPSSMEDKENVLITAKEENNSVILNLC